MATLSQMRTKFVEFDKVDDPVVQGALDEAALFIGTTLPSGSNGDFAQMYLAAHFLAVAKATTSASGREIVSETIGRLSRTFARSTGVGAPLIGDLRTTFYGRRYLDFKNLGNPAFKSIPLSHDVKRSSSGSGC